MFEDDEMHLNNPLLKFSQCIVPSNYHIKDVISSIPSDVQALILNIPKFEKMACESVKL